MPGHTGGWLALKDAGLQFCGSFPAHEERPQLYHDPVRHTNPQSAPGIGRRNPPKAERQRTCTAVA